MKASSRMVLGLQILGAVLLMAASAQAEFKHVVMTVYGMD